MDLRTHLFNRREVVAIFIDVDATMLETDLALPVPLKAARANADGAAVPSSPPPSPPPSAGEAAKYVPPHSRFEVVREAVRSFVVQKERAAPHAGKLFFALYAVLAAEVVELLPPMPSGQPVVDAAFRRYLGKDGAGRFQELLSTVLEGRSPKVPFPTVSASAAAGGAAAGEEEEDVKAGALPSPAFPFPFPFAAVSLVLEGIGAFMASETEPAASSSPAQSGDVAAWSAPTDGSGVGLRGSRSNLSPRRSMGGAMLCVQGVVLLSRATELPSAEAEALPAREGTDVWMDVLHLAPPPPPTLPLSPSAPARKDGSGASHKKKSRPSNGSSSRRGIGSAVAVGGVPCIVIDPVAFTGIAHRGLAVGPSLTKCLASHAHGTDALRQRQLHRPVFMVDLPTASALAAGPDPSHMSNDEEMPSPRLRASAAPSPVLDLAPPHAGLSSQSSSHNTVDGSTGPSIGPPVPLSGLFAEPAPLAAKRSSQSGSGLLAPAKPNGAAVQLPPLQPEKLPPPSLQQGRRTPHLTSPPQSRVTTIEGISASGSATSFESPRQPHYVRGTVVAGGGGGGGAAAPSTARRSATAEEPLLLGLASTTAPTSAGANAEQPSPNDLPALAKALRSPLTGKRQGLQLRAIQARHDSGSGSSSHHHLTPPHHNDSSTSACVNEAEWASGNDPDAVGLQSVSSSVYPSEMLRRDSGDAHGTSITPLTRAPLESRARAESTGSAIKRRKQQVQQQFDPYHSWRGTSLGATPIASAASTACAEGGAKADPVATNPDRNSAARRELI